MSEGQTFDNGQFIVAEMLDTVKRFNQDEMYTSTSIDGYQVIIHLIKDEEE